MAGNDPTINVKINGDSSGLQTELGKASQGVMKAVADMKARAQQLDLSKTLGDSEKMPTLVEGFRKMNSVLGQTKGAITAADSGVMSMAGNLSSLAGALGLAFGVGSIVSFTRSIFESADAAEAYAKALGIPMDQLIALQRSAESFGQSGEKVLTWLQKVRDFQDSIVGGGAGAAAALDKLAAVGIDGESWAAKLPSRALEELMQKSHGAATGVGLLNDVLGKASASDATEAFQDLAANGLNPLIAKYEEAEKAAGRLADTQGRFEKAKGDIKDWYANQIGGFLETSAKYNEAMGLGKYNVAGFGLAGLNRAGGAGIVGRLSERWLPAAAPIAGETEQELAAKRKAAIAEEAARQKAAADKKAQGEADKRRQTVLDSFFKGEGEDQFRKSIQATMAGMSNNDMSSAISDIYKALSDNSEMFSLKEINDMVFRYKELVKELEKRYQRDASLDEKRTAGSAKYNQDVSNEMKRRGQALDGITVGVPRLTGIEALGGVMGGTGGYARSLAEAQQKAADIAKQSDQKLASIQAAAEDAAKSLKG